MQTTKKPLIILLLIIVMGIVASFALLVPPGKTSFTFHSYFALALTVAILYAAAAVFFIKGLGNFKAGLKRAYGFICAGIAILGVATLQLPILMALNQLDGLWKSSGIIVLPYVAGILFIYIGSRLFARLFGIKNLSTSLWFFMVTPVVLAILFSFLPHAPTATPEAEFDAANAFSVWNWFAIALSGVFILQVKRVAGVIYTNALAWLLLAFWTMPTATVGYLISISILGDDQSNFIATAALGPLAVAGVFLVLSAYSFKYTTAEGKDMQGWVARNFFGTPLSPVQHGVATPVDIVIYAANLVSDPRAIDATLDTVRHVTATSRSNQDLSKADEAVLSKAYLDIERHLLEHDPLRTFTRDGLRQRIANELHLSTASTFWSKLNQGDSATTPS